MSKLVHNYTANGSSTTDEYGTHLVLNRLLQGDVVEGFAVVANGTPNMTVLVQPGSGRVSTGTYPSSYGYLISHDTSAGEPVTISTAAASPRIDYVLAYVDKGVAGSTSPTYVNNSNNVLKFAAVSGTPAGSPNPPTTSQINTAIGASNPYIILAQISVGASVSSITNANIADKRTLAGALPPQTSWQVWNTTIAAATVGNGVVTGRYIKIGKTVHARMHFIFGSTTTITSGQDISFTPPVPYTNYAAAYFVTPVGAGHYERQGVSNYVCQIILSNTDQLFKPLVMTRGADDYVHWRALQNGVPVTMASGDWIDFAVTYEAA